MHMSVKFTSARFDEYETNHKKKRRTSLEEKVLGLTEKVDKLSSAVDRQEQYSREIAFSYMV